MKMVFFSKFIKSMIDSKSYNYFCNEKKGRTIGYLFLVCLIFTTLISIKTVFSVNRGINQFEKYFKTQVPDFTLSDGILKTEPNEHIIIGNSDEYPIIIDTTNNADVNELDNYNEGALILKDKLIVKENSAKKEEYSFTTFGAGINNINKADIEGWIPVLKLVNIIVVIAIFIGFTAGKFISALILALIGLIINGIIGTKFSFGKLYKLGIYALTLPIILSVVRTLLEVNIPIFSVIYYGIGALYMWRGMNAIKSEELYSLGD